MLDIDRWFQSLFDLFNSTNFQLVLLSGIRHPCREFAVSGDDALGAVASSLEMCCVVVCSSHSADGLCLWNSASRPSADGCRTG